MRTLTARLALACASVAALAAAGCVDSTYLGLTCTSSAQCAGLVCDNRVCSQAATPPAGLAVALDSVTVATAGQQALLDVTAVDTFGDKKGSYDGQVPLAMTCTGCAAPGPCDSFSLQAKINAGFGTLLPPVFNRAPETCSFSSAGLTVTSSITVQPGAAASFKVTAPPSTLPGVAFSVEVAALDSSKNVATGYTGTAHITATAECPALTGNTNLTFAAGKAQTLLTGSAPGNCNLAVTDGTLASLPQPLQIACDASKIFWGGNCNQALTAVIAGGAGSCVVGSTTQLSATCRDAAGDAVACQSATWTSSAPAVAAVSASGLVSCLTPGASVITASQAGISGSLNLTSNSLTPGVPTNVSASAGNAQATVSWNPPASQGASPLVGYTITGTPGNVKATAGGFATSVVVTGLPNGASYSFTVHATNSGGDGPESASSNAVVPSVSAGSVPSAPQNVTVTPGYYSATVSWQAPAFSGTSAVNGYTVTSYPGGLTAQAGPAAASATVTGLTAGTAYQFSVHASNGLGLGAESPPTTAVTPTGLSQSGSSATDALPTVADGTAAAQVKFTILDTTNKPAAGQLVTFSTTSTISLSAASASTDASGLVKVNATSTVPGNAIIKATVGTVTLYANAPFTCTSGFSACGTTCVDQQSDAHHCGSCFGDCGAYACHGGQCNAPLATGLNYPAKLAAGANYVFFSDLGNQTIYAVLAGSATSTPTPFVSGVASVDALAALGNLLFYQAGTSTFAIADDGSPAVKVATGVAAGRWTVNNGRLFYVTGNGSTLALWTATLDGTNAFPVGPASSGASGLLGGGLCTMYLDATAAGGSTVSGVPLTGGLTLTVSTPGAVAGTYLGVGADPQYVYYNDSAGWRRVLRGGGAPLQMTNNVFLQKFETDGVNDFALLSTGKTVNSKPVYDLVQFAVGATVTQTVYPSVGDFDLQGSALYVTDPGQGTIVRIAKPGTPGGGTAQTATCACTAGYVGDGKVCRSCNNNNGGCDNNATCAVANAQVSCTCKAGYVGNGVSCASACSINNGGCDPNATCTNGTSGVTCACKTSAGWSGNGLTCTYDPCTDVSHYGNNGGCSGGDKTIASCTNNGGAPQCTCLSPYADATGAQGPGCYLNLGSFSHSVQTQLTVGPCTQTTGGHPTLTFAAAAWNLSQSGFSSSSAGSATLTWANCPSLSMSGAPTKNGPIVMTSSSGTCNLADNQGGAYTITGVTSLNVYRNSIGQNAFSIAGVNDLLWTPSGQPQYTCYLELYAGPY